MNIEAKVRERRRRERQQAKREAKEERRRLHKLEKVAWQSAPGGQERQAEVDRFARELAEFTGQQ